MGKILYEPPKSLTVTFQGKEKWVAKKDPEENQIKPVGTNIYESLIIYIYDDLGSCI